MPSVCRPNPTAILSAERSNTISNEAAPVSELAQPLPFPLPLDTSPSTFVPPLSHSAEARLLWRVRAKMLAASLRQSLSTARLRVSLVIVLSLFFWYGLFRLFGEGFEFLSMTIAHSATHAQTVQAIYNVFFASLMMMLVISSGIILYSGLYCSSEAEFLLTTPVRPERIVLHKFQEAIVFSSWGFLLLGSPMLVAYGLQADAPWYYFALLLPFMAAFVYIPGGIGAILCMLFVHRMARIQRHFVALVILATIAALGLFGWSLLGKTEGNLLTPGWFQEMLGRLEFSEHRMLPSWWLSSGLLEAARNDDSATGRAPWSESLLFLSLLISNALFLRVLAVSIGRRVYRTSYSELRTERARRRPRQNFWLDRLVTHYTPLLTPQMRLLIVKDLRLFRRDPVQWSQFIIFFGLLTLYFANIRRFSYDVHYTAWVNMISFLNLAVVGLILSTFTTRFIFPMLSLEGRRFWILGMLPVRRDSILWGKFLFAATGSAMPCCVLILLSDLMLQISPLVLAIHQLTCLLLCLGLSGIAVGLGAKMPDLREESPSKIAAGFGGTLNLVISAIYIIAVVLLTALPSHFYLAALQNDMDPFWFRAWLIGGTIAACVTGLLATFVPMHVGLKAFRALEL
jgi:ABC-2 type transport system permease protein